MNKKLSSTLVASVAFVTLLFALSCGRGNQNLVNDQNSANGSPKPTPSTATDADPCSNGTIGDKLPKVITHVAGKITHSPGLNKLVNTDHRLSVDVTLGPGNPATYLQLHIGGRVGGNANFLELINIVEKVMKGDCTAKVIFDNVVWTNGVPPPTPPGPAPTGTPSNLAIGVGREFIWTACEEGTIPCAGGCCQYVPSGAKSDDGNMNISSNSGNNNK